MSTIRIFFIIRDVSVNLNHAAPNVFVFATAKVDTKKTKYQIFESPIFPRGGDNYLIINTMKNQFLPIFQPSDYQGVTKPLLDIR